jgi:hypothetical protein
MENADMSAWRISSYSSNGGGTCVEVGQSAGAVLVRDTKQAGQADRTALAFAADAWLAFLASLR